MGFELEEIFYIVGLAATVAVFIHAYRALKDAASLRWKLLAALVGLTAYLNLTALTGGEGNELLTPGGLFDIWFRHIFFYGGQLLFFMFINAAIFQGSAAEQPPRRRRDAGAMAVFLLLATLQLLAPREAHARHAVDLLVGELTPYRVFLFLTDQGVQHVIAIVFFAISLAVLRSQTIYAELHLGFASRKRAVTAFLIGNTMFILLHVWEFLAESWHLFAFLPHDAVETIEYAFFFAGLAFFFSGVRRLGGIGSPVTAKA